MKRTYTCDLCNRKLPHERWIFSQHTKARYCWPGECGHDKPRKRKAKSAPITDETLDQLSRAGVQTARIEAMRETRDNAQTALAI